MAIDWKRSMQQRFRYYEVDPMSWRDVREIDTVVSCEVTRDLESDTRESASLTIVGGTIDEKIIRAYMECRQADASTGELSGWERFAIGTWMCQTPKRTWRRGVGELQVNAYSMLLPVSDDKPPVFHTVRSGSDPAVQAVIALSNGVAPVVPCVSGSTLEENHSCDPGEDWLELANEMAGAASMMVMVDAFGKPYLEVDKDPAGLSASWTYEDNEDSILLGGIDDQCDWYKLPNVVEVVADANNSTFIGTAVNDSPLSLLSVGVRGRRVVERITKPELANVTQAAADRLASKKLSELGSVERKLTYEHGYCPVRLGDCVRILSRRHGIDTKGRVVRQTMTLATGCTVTEDAVCEMTMGDSV